MPDNLRRLSIVAVRLLCFAAVAAAQTPTENPTPATGEASFTVFIRGTDVGRVQTNLARTGSDWLITSTGRVGDLTVNRFELKYGADWQPIELRIEATQAADKKLLLNTSFGVTTAINEITQNAVTNAKTDQVSARTVVLPNSFFAGYEGLAARLSVAGPGTELPVYVAPQAEVRLTVKSVTSEPVHTLSGDVSTRRYEVVIQNPGGPLNATHLMATLSFQRAIPGGSLGEGAAIATAMVPFLLAAILFSYFGLQRRAWQQGGSDK